MPNDKIDSLKINNTTYDITLNEEVTPHIYKVQTPILLIDGDDPDDIFDKPGHTEKMINKLIKNDDTSNNYYVETDYCYIPAGSVIDKTNAPTLKFKSSHYSGKKSFGLPTPITTDIRDGRSYLRTGKTLTISCAFCDPNYDKIVVYYMNGTNSGTISLNSGDVNTYYNVSHFRLAGTKCDLSVVSSTVDGRTVYPGGLVCMRPYVKYDSQDRWAYNNFCAVSNSFWSTNIGTGIPTEHQLPVDYNDLNTIRYARFFIMRDCTIKYVGVND